MISSLVDAINSLLCWINSHQIFKVEDKNAKCNIGSDLSIADGWINIDANIHLSRVISSVAKYIYLVFSPKRYKTRKMLCSILDTNVFIHHDVKYGLPFDSESIGYLFSSHVIEHLYKEDAEKLLSEAWRVLRMGGVFRICVPNLEYAFSLYQEGEKERALSFFFSGKEANRHSRHRYMYDYESLTDILLETGFSSVELCSYRQGVVPDIEKLDKSPAETLYLEAHK